MAIDSRAKRASAANLPFMLLFPEPDGSVEVTDRMVMAGSAAILAWVSPDSHDASCETNWDDCVNAYDDNLATYAVEKVADTGEWLTLKYDTPLRIDAYRLIGNEEGTDPYVLVQLYEGGVWRYEDEESPTVDEWHERVGFGPARISKVRIKSLDLGDLKLGISGFQVRSLGQFYPAAARTLVNGGLYATPLIKGGLVR